MCLKVRRVFDCLKVGLLWLAAGAAAAPLLGVCHRRGVGWVGLDSLFCVFVRVCLCLCVFVCAFCVSARRALGICP